MTVEEIISTITDDLEKKIRSGEYEWESICSSLVLEESCSEYGIVVWCDNSDGSGKYFTVSIRETNGAKHIEDWNEILCESTDTNNFEQLKYSVTNMLLKLHKLGSERKGAI